MGTPVPAALRRAVAPVAFVVLTAIAFVVDTLAVNAAVGRPLALLSPAAAAVVLLIATPWRGERPSVRSAWPWAAAGVAGLLAAPYLVAASRSTDAPSGSEVLFFTTAAWGSLLVLGALLPRAARPAPHRVALVLLAAAGSAALVANWERPSSFSPFVKFPAQEVAMLAAGAAFAAFVLVLRAAAPSVRGRVALVGTSAAAAAGLLALPFSGGLTALSAFAAWPLAAPALLLHAFAVLAVVRVLEDGTAVDLAALFPLVPVLLTAFTLVEEVIGARGPRPILVGPALAASALVVVAVTGALADRRADAPGRMTLAARSLSAIAALAALGGLAAPALSATVHGSTASGAAFDASFVLQGWETAGGWIAAALAAVAVAYAWAPGAARPAPARLIVRLAGLGMVVAAYALLAGTPLHTWTSWIPPEVQQDYGTPFARITFGPRPDVIRPVAAFAAAVSLALAWSGAVRRNGSDGGDTLG